MLRRASKEAEARKIFAQDDKAHSTVTVRNAGKKLVLRSVDLSGPPEQVEQEIAVLADAIAKTSPVATLPRVGA